jgi:hypothetical protein
MLRAGRTRVEGGLKDRQPVVLQHVQECLRAIRGQLPPSTPLISSAHRLARIVEAKEEDFGVLVQQAWSRDS